MILQHFSFSATFIWPQLESNYWIYIHELKKLGNSFTSELLIRNGNKTLCFLKAKLAFINLFLCMLKLEPRKVPIFYYITVTSKSAILWTKEHFIIHYKPRCMLFRFVLLFLGPKSGTKRGLTVFTFRYYYFSSFKTKTKRVRFSRGCLELLKVVPQSGLETVLQLSGKSNMSLQNLALCSC